MIQGFQSIYLMKKCMHLDSSLSIFILMRPDLITRNIQWDNYHKISNVSNTESQNLNDPRLVLQLSLPNPLKPGVTSRIKM